jgi:hypothetical protein
VISGLGPLCLLRYESANKSSCEDHDDWDHNQQDRVGAIHIRDWEAQRYLLSLGHVRSGRIAGDIRLPVCWSMATWPVALIRALPLIVVGTTWIGHRGE